MVVPLLGASNEGEVGKLAIFELNAPISRKREEIRPTWLLIYEVAYALSCTKSCAYATVFRPSVCMSVVCDVCIVAQRCVLEEKVTIDSIGSCI